MGCLSDCRCRCGQSGCACHRATASATTTTATVEGPQVRCNMCGRIVPGQYRRSPLGRVVTAIFCGGCDIAHPKR